MSKKTRELFKEDIIHLFTQKKLNLSSVAETLKINRLDVKKVLIANQLYMESRIYLKNEPEIQKTIVHLYEIEGLPLREISAQINFDVRAIKRILIENNIPLKHAGEYNRKYSSDDRAFEVYSPESVYWAGFIAGDGCVYSHGLSDKTFNNCLTVGLSIVDKEHLLKLKKFLKYDGVLYEAETKIALNVNNRNIVKSLGDNYAISNNKTDIYKPPSTIPQHLIKYFVLGLLDSDGSISKIKRPPTKTNKNYKGVYVYQFNFTGTNEVCEFVKEFFGSSVKLTKRHANEVNNYTVFFQGNLQVKNYLSRLYDEISLNFCLKRKHEKYIELVEQYKDKSSVLETEQSISQ